MYPCHREQPAPITRRQMLRQSALGFGSLALTALAAEQCRAAAAPANAFARPPHFTPRAKNIIFLYMDGGVSAMDSFDPKPLLTKEHGQPFKMKVEPTQFNNNGNTLGSPWAFKNYGQSGLPVSELFPHIASCADELAVIRSMTSNFSEHTGANYFLHTGHGQQGRPSMGAWTTYGLGSECQNLLGFVVLDSGLIPPGGLDCFSNGFLPATFQGSVFQPGPEPVAYLQPREKSSDRQKQKLSLLHSLDDAGLRRQAHEDK